MPFYQIKNFQIFFLYFQKILLEILHKSPIVNKLIGLKVDLTPGTDPTDIPLILQTLESNCQAQEVPQ
jgi:hypothetical protein